MPNARWAAKRKQDKLASLLCITFHQYRVVRRCFRLHPNSIGSASNCIKKARPSPGALSFLRIHFALFLLQHTEPSRHRVARPVNSAAAWRTASIERNACRRLVRMPCIAHASTHFSGYFRSDLLSVDNQDFDEVASNGHRGADLEICVSVLVCRRTKCQFPGSLP